MRWLAVILAALILTAVAGAAPIVTGTTENTITVGGLACGTSYRIRVNVAGSTTVTTLNTATRPCPIQHGPGPGSFAGGGWAFCALENQTCAVSGTKEVTYGQNSTWTTPRSFSASVSCSNSVFGDPLYGVVKECWSRDPAISPPPPPPPPPPPGPNFSGDFNCYGTTGCPSLPTPLPCTTTILASGLQSALNNATGGEVICLQSGSTGPISLGGT